MQGNRLGGRPVKRHGPVSLKVGSIDHSETIIQFIYLYSHQPFEEIEAAHPGLRDPMKRQRNIHQTTFD